MIDNCVICLGSDRLKLYNKKFDCNCKCFFHKRCFKEYKKHDYKCPFCRSEMILNNYPFYISPVISNWLVDSLYSISLVIYVLSIIIDMKIGFIALTIIGPVVLSERNISPNQFSLLVILSFLVSLFLFYIGFI